MAFEDFSGILRKQKTMRSEARNLAERIIQCTPVLIWSDIIQAVDKSSIVNFINIISLICCASIFHDVSQCY